MPVKGAPDFTYWFTPVMPVGDDAVPAESIYETPVFATEGKISNSDQTYQTLATWTVTSGKGGKLYRVELASSNYSKTHFKFTIGGVVQWEGLELPSVWTGVQRELPLAPEDVVLLEGKSNDGTAVDMWGMVDGAEVG